MSNNKLVFCSVQEDSFDRALFLQITKKHVSCQVVNKVLCEAGLFRLAHNYDVPMQRQFECSYFRKNSVEGLVNVLFSVFLNFAENTEIVP